MEWLHDLVVRDDTLETWKRRRAEIKARIETLLGEQPPATEPLDIDTLEEEDRAGILYRKIEYTVEPDERVRAWLLLPPKRPQPFSAVLCLHGTSPHGKEGIFSMKKDRSYPEELAKRGYVTLAPDTITMGERVFPGCRPLDTAPFYKRFPNRTIQGKNIWDQKRALDVLEQMPEVDRTKIGAMGHSLGGRSTHYLTAFDERVSCAAISCGIIPLASNYLLFAPKIYDALPTLREILGKGLPFEKHELTSLIAPRPVMIVSPANDRKRRTDVMSAMMHRLFAVYRLYEKESHLCQFLHGDGHTTTPFTRELIYQWMDRHLNAGKYRK